MGQISIYFQNRDAVKEAIKELEAVLERSKFHYSTDIQPAHFKGVDSVQAKGISKEGRAIKRDIRFEHGILTVRTRALDRPYMASKGRYI